MSPDLIPFILLLFFCAAGIIAVFFNFFGNLIILSAAVLYSWATHFNHLPIKTLAVLLGLYLTGEVLDTLCALLGAKKFGASNRAIAFGFIGGLIGAVIGFFFLGIGMFFGGLAGIFLSTVMIEYSLHKNFPRSLKAGAGTLFGAVTSIILKTLISFVMVGVILITIASRGGPLS